MVQPINYLVPGRVDIGAKLSGLGQAIVQNRAAAQERDRQEQFKAELQSAIQSGSLRALKDLQIKYPKLSEGLKDRIGEMTDEQRRNEMTAALEMRNAAKAGDADTVGRLIDQRINAAMAEGKDTSSLERIRNAADVGNMAAVVSGLNVGLMGLMGPKDFKDLADIDFATGKVEGITGLKVQSSEIYADGTVQSVMSDGSVVVTSPEGKVLQGEKAQAAVQKAQEFSNLLAGKREYGKGAGRLGATAQYGAEAKGAEEAGKQGIKLAEEANEAYSKIVTNIGNLDTAIDAIDRGANTGVIASLFPSVNTATIELEAAANKLGLDIVGAVTFGALSEGELNLAMSTAIPTNLDEQALRSWLVRKKEAQQKLAAYMREQARFLSKPGNTLYDWLEKGKKRPSGAMGMGTPTADDPLGLR